MTFSGQHSEQYITGRELGKGGEGSVYELQSHRGFVLKKYNEPLTLDKVKKLELMVAMRSPSIEAYAAWPVDIVKDSTGTVCGFVMKKLTGYVPLHHVFSPMDRKKMFPDKGYNFLVHVARNVATAFYKLHEAGLVVGDVNEGNILISSSGMAAFIDCDSFQVKGISNYFFCEVGVPRYTPPELLKKQSFEEVIRTTNTDNFSLAVLIFQLLFLGRHPFAGRHKSAADIDEETAIRQKQFAYSLENKKRKLAPPPDSFSITNLPDELVTLFHRAFEQDDRPSPVQWVKALDGLLTDTATCDITRLHTYPALLTECPWCLFRKQKGIMYFLDDSYFEAQTILGNIESFIQGFRPERPVIKKLDLSTPLPLLTPSAIEKKFVNAKRLRTFRTFFMLGLSTLIFIYAIWAIDVSFVLGAGISYLTSYAVYKFSRLTKLLNTEGDNLMNTYNSLRNKLSFMIREYESPADMATFDKGVATLQQLIHDFRRLPDELERRRRIMEDKLYNEQLDDYLWEFSIDDHAIPGIGAAKKNALYNNGFRNAAQLSKLPSTKVPGIGPAFEQVLMTWRRQMSAGFVYIPDNYKINIAIQKVNDEVAQLKLQLESSIRREYQSINFLKLNIQNRAAIIQGQVADMRIKVRQAEIDMNAFKKFAA